MRTHTSRRRGIALAAVSAVAASTLLGLPAQADPAAPAPTHGATVDYFDDVYTDLGPDSVFETVTIERFEYILKNVPGNVAFFIGDPSQASSQATIGHINEVAKEQGIDRIYNFTPKLDGGTLNVWDLSASGLRALGRDYYAAVGDRLIDDYLSKDVDTPFTKEASSDPYLFVYNKDHVDGDDQDRIVAALTDAPAADDLDTETEVEAYENDVADVLGSVDDYVTTTNFQFQKAENNRRHTTTAAYANAVAYGGNILEDSDNAEGFRIKTLTYPELVHLLQQPGDIPILFGGTWCHNTRAIIKFVNADAQKYGIKTVYNFDFSLFSTSNGGSNYDHIRDNPLEADEEGVLKVARPSHLYGDLVNTYLTNAVTQYKKTGDPGAGNANFVSYYPGGDTSVAKKEARKIQVGHLLTYNKDHKDGLGNPAPVVDQAIRQNDDGGNTEFMTEWWYTSGRNLAVAGDASEVLNGPVNTASQAGRDTLQNQRNFAKEAIDDIDAVLAGVGDQSVASTTSVAAASSVQVGTAPTVSVSVGANGYTPFISLNSANANVAPVSAEGKPRGVVAVFAGDEQIGTPVRLKRDGTASITLPTQTSLGAKSFTVRYLGRGDRIAASSATLAFTVAKPSSVLTVPAAATTYGKPGTIAVATTGPDGYVPTGTVRVSVAGASYAATLDAQGRALVALPTTLLPKTYAVTVVHEGDANLRASSTTSSFTVAKASASAPKFAKKGTVKAAKKGKATVTVKTPSGLVKASGKVKIQLTKGKTKKTITVTLASGTAKVNLPKLAKGSWKVKVTYLGNTTYNAGKTVSSTLKVK